LSPLPRHHSRGLLSKAELEKDRRAIIKRDGVDIRGAGRQVRRGDVEDPLLTIPAEGRVRIIRVDDVFNIRGDASSDDLSQVETSHNTGISDGNAIRFVTT
jgi:hypothetical protein